MVDLGTAAQVAFPNAKVNLGLQVRHRREDGFHALDSLFLPIPWCDTLEVATPGTGDGCTLHLHGLPVAGAPEDNLICRAHALLAERHALPPVDFHLIKALPSGAGLGGGSADGAFALTLLNSLFDLGHSIPELEDLAAQLGSDCPFFIRNVPARVTGRGEHIDPIDLRLEGWHIALINPGIHISTAEAFGWVRPDDNRPGLDAWAGTAPEDWSGGLQNDFTGPAVARHPTIGTALDVLRQHGAAFADMSGSGSTVFGFFRAPMPQDWAGALPDGCRTWTGQFSN